MKKLISAALAAIMLTGNPYTVIADEAVRPINDEPHAVVTDADDDAKDSEKNGTVYPMYYVPTTNSVKLTWNCSDHRVFYIYQKQKDGSYKKIGTHRDTRKDSYYVPWDQSYKVTGLKPNRSYRFKIASKHKTGVDKATGKAKYKKVFSDELIVRTRPKAPKITKVQVGSSAVKLSWKKVDCDGYKIQINKRIDKGPNFKDIGTVKTNGKTSFKIKGLEPGHDYQFVVQSYTKFKGNYEAWSDGYIGKNMVRSEYSEVVTVTTKK